jgi:hypothetical protein
MFNIGSATKNHTGIEEPTDKENDADNTEKMWSRDAVKFLLSQIEENYDKFDTGLKKNYGRKLPIGA